MKEIRNLVNTDAKIAAKPAQGLTLLHLRLEITYHRSCVMFAFRKKERLCFRLDHYLVSQV